MRHGTMPPGGKAREHALIPLSCMAMPFNKQKKLSLWGIGERERERETLLEQCPRGRPERSSVTSLAYLLWAGLTPMSITGGSGDRHCTPYAGRANPRERERLGEILRAESERDPARERAVLDRDSDSGGAP